MKPTCPVVGEANRVIEVRDAKFVVHVAPQSIPAGELATLPVPPFRTLATVSVNVPDGGGGGASEVLKVALTAVSLLICTVQAPVPPQAPPQPAKMDPEAATAVSVTVVPPENDREQVVPQLMPLGLLATVPVPVPFLLTWSVNVPLLPLPLASKPPAEAAAVWLG